MGRLIVLFTVVPLVELYLLLLVADLVGFWTTVFIVLVTGALGAVLAKAEGLKVWRSWQTALRAGQIPEEGVIGSLLILMGGVLLVTPGVLTDLLGLGCLIPFCRRRIALWVRTFLERSMQSGQINVIRSQSTIGSEWIGNDPTDSNEVFHEEVVEAQGETVEESVKKKPIR